MRSSAEERIRKLTKGMLRKKLYVVLSKAKGGSDQLKPYLASHLEYMIGLEKKGVLVASGPLTELGGNMRGDGMTILRAKTADEAREIAEGDPFFVHGIRTFEIREWTIMEGSVAIRVNFSDQSTEVT
jgi:uncharacterized protein